MKTRWVAISVLALAAIAVVWYCLYRGETQRRAQGKASTNIPPVAGVATNSQAMTASLVIRKAVYGDLADGVAMDVTDKVRASVQNGKLTVVADDGDFGDPYNGKDMKLTIIKAEARSPNLNFGGSGGSADVTQLIKQFQNGNRLEAKMSGGSLAVTVYYRYGKGRVLSKQLAGDGSIVIAPPRKLRVEYTLNGMDNCKIVDHGDKMEINDEIEAARNDLNPFLGRWTASWGDVRDDVTVEIRDGVPRVVVSDSKVSDEKLDCGVLSWKETVVGSDYRFVDTAVPTTSGLESASSE